MAIICWKAKTRFCLKGGLIADALIMCVYLPLLFTGVLGNNNYGVAKPYIIIACLIPVLTYLQEVFLLYFRSNLMNRVYSRVSVLYTVLYAAFQILLALAFSIRGVFVGRYIALGLIVLLCFLYTRKTGIIKQNAPSLTIREKKEILWFGFGAMIANAFSLVMPLNETLVVNLVMKDFSMTAYYKAASMIPSNLQFIATSVVVFIFPYFAKHSGDGRWIQKNILRLLVGMVCLMVPIMLIGYVCSPWIISIIYGKDYAPAIAIMKPMWIAFGINSILRVPLGNALAALGEIRFNIILSVIISLLHFALDYVFISRFGLTGASYALMISYTVSSVASLAYCLIMCKRKWMEKEEA